MTEQDPPVPPPVPSEAEQEAAQRLVEEQQQRNAAAAEAVAQSEADAQEIIDTANPDPMARGTGTEGGGSTQNTGRRG